MGMAASQARLLCITARIHDVEYQAQSIQNAKTQLATLSDRAYQDYLQELEDTTLTINSLNSSGETTPVVANFNTLCSRNRVKSADGNEYAIRDKNNKLVVEDAIFEAYEEFNQLDCTKDAYTFAMYMISGDTGNRYGVPKDELYKYEGLSDMEAGIRRAEELAYANATEEGKNTSLTNKYNAVLSAIQNVTITDASKTYRTDNIYDPDNVVSLFGTAEQKTAYKEALMSYKEALYKGSAAEIEAAASHYEDDNTENFNSNLFNYYVSIYNQIEYCGGCKSIADYNGFNGDAANNEEWLQAMIQCGEFSIEIVKNSRGNVGMEATSPSSDISLSYTATTEVDSKAMRIAEAKYEHKLDEINAKDKQYDLSLSKLETERSALTTQYDSLKKVIEDNIERTFGIFS